MTKNGYSDLTLALGVLAWLLFLVGFLLSVVGIMFLALGAGDVPPFSRYSNNLHVWIFMMLGGTISAILCVRQAKKDKEKRPYDRV